MSGVGRCAHGAVERGATMEPVERMEPAAVTVEGLRVVRGARPVLDGLTVRIASGVVTGLLGPSGSGKMTLLRSIVGVQRVAGGAVSVLGLPAGSAGLRARVV